CGGVAGAGWVTNATDCEDGLPSVHPGAVEVCNGVDDDCVDGEPNDAICGLPGVVLSSCEGGACVVQSCEAGLEDCDGLASNGCEIDLLADGMRRCGALCVAMTDPNACGSECRVCAPPLSDGVATCDGTICGARCASTGYVLVAGASLDCVWDDPSLSSLEPSIGSLDPVFFPSTLSYRIDVPLSTTTFSLTPRSSAPDPATEVTIALQLRASSEFVASGSPSAAAALDPGNNVFTITVTAETGATRAYTLTVFRGTIRTDAYLKASSTDTLDFFGRAVAVEGDTLVIGASREDGAATGVGGDPADDSALDSGAVYVFVRGATGVWTPQAYLKASNTGGGDLFGASVSISGDTLVIGAPREDSDAVGVGGDQANDSATDGGAAYVFVRDAAGTWSQQAYLKASNTEAGDHFGVSVALSGDTLVVGADGEDSSSVGVGGAESDNGASGSGAAYVFVRGAAGAWSQQAYLKPSNTGASDEFGKELAIDADTLVIAAHLEDSNAPGVDGSQLNDTATDSGAAYVFVRDAAGAWAQQAYLKASNTGPADWFGRDVDVHLDTVVVGAPWEALGAGAAYVFVRDGAGGWSQEAFLKASNAESSDLFGECVTVGDGTIAVGAQNEDSNALGIDGFQGNWLGDSGYDAGAAYVFSRDHLGGWTQEAYLKASNTDAGDRFGLHIALDGRVLVVSTTLEASRATGVDGNQFDNSTAGAGAAYVFIL
ncbi:MAG: cadherin-like beta sandwich domain-containing protein, partial [Myxococcales bacterium]|nr:cadherin-like beta sandwich domain-containing protein [Myxococcales bacterium]